MLAAVIQKTTPWWQTISLDWLSWFDVALLLVIVFGYWLGRRRGMTKQCLPALQWLSIMLGAGLGHPYVASLFEQYQLVTKHTQALMFGYLAIFAVLFIFFTILKSKLNPKLEGSNMFGGGEYHLAVIAGITQFLCMVLVALALLNGPIYTQADIAASKAYNNRWFGGGMQQYSGDFIPSLYEIQDSVFKKSFAGKFIKDYLIILLINPVTPGSGPVKKPHS
jgi:uncharacterized membrane protein required for colicin V production